MQKRLQDPATGKEYLVLVRGSAPDAFVSHRWLTARSGTRQPAETRFRTLAQLGPVSLVAARIHTGRTHQIRRHLNPLGHHVVGDSTHGKGRINRLLRTRYALPRMFLHAWRLDFAHPTSGTPLRFTASLPDDLVQCLRHLPGGAPFADVLGARADAPTPTA